MQNLEKHKESLTELEQNLRIYKESIREIAEEIVQAEVSKYPIFVASKEPVSIGKMVIDKEELALEWSIFASTLEEFVRRKIITQEKLNAFRSAWKSPETHCCIFALIDDTASFIYVPYD
jgi:hypothetical protein